MPTEEEQKRLDALITGNDVSGATFGATPEEQSAQITDIFRNVYGQDPSQEDIAKALPMATGKQADFARKLGTLESGFGSLQFHQQGEAGKPVAAYNPGEQEKASLAERQGLGTTGTASKSYTYWDEGRGVQVHAAPGQHFELYDGGGVKVVDGLIARNVSKDAPNSSLFNQGTNAQGAVAGFKQESLAYKPIDGKTIAETGQTVFNPLTKVDEHAGEGEILIKYTDGTVERRKIGGTPGEAVDASKFGRTPGELGLNPDGSQNLGKNTDPNAEQGGNGLAMSSNLEVIGTSYTTPDGQKRTAPKGSVFMQDPKTRKIVLRPESQAQYGQESTSQSVLAERKKLEGQIQEYLPNADFSQIESAFQSKPIKSFQDLYTSILESQGVPQIKAELEIIQKQQKELDDSHAEAVQKINDNPYYSEALRSKKLALESDKYETKKGLLTARQTLQNTLLQESRQEAQFVSSTALAQYNADRQFQREEMQFAAERAEAKLDAQIKLAAVQQDQKQWEQEFGLKAQAQEFGQALDLKKLGLTSAKSNKSGGSGSGSGGSMLSGTGDISKLSSRAQSVVKNPTLLNSYTPTEKGKILDELAVNNIDTSSFGLPNVSQGARDNIDRFDSMIRNASEAVSLIEGLNTGPVASRVLQAQRALGGAEQFTNYASSISRMNSLLLNQLSGAAITPQEYERLKPFIPTELDDEATAKRKLERFVGEITSTQGNYVNRSTQTPYQIQQSVQPNNQKDPLGIR